MKNLVLPLTLAALLAANSCAKNNAVSPDVNADDDPIVDLSLENVAKIVSCLPIGQDQMDEVHGAVSSSSTDGYDEEYTMEQLIGNPGAGVGETKGGVSRQDSKKYAVPMRDLLADYFALNSGTKAASSSAAEQCLKELSESGLQIYWPYSEDWDGETLPLITYDPGYEIKSNYAYELRMTENGLAVVDSVYVDENVAKQRPVWVINNNRDASFVPLESISLYQETKSQLADNCRLAAMEANSETDESASTSLYLKSICALRNYDSWFAGGSEFFIKAGSVTGLKVTENDDLRNYYPQLNDIMVVVKRREIGQDKEIDNMLVSDFSEYQDKIAFMLTEDDGGTITNWTCNATVKIKSKSYGIEISIPFNSRDDIIWRGQIDAAFFRKTAVTTGRFGDVKLTFEVK